MDILTRSLLRSLAQQSHPHAISMLFPTHRTGEEGKQDKLRLKNMLRQADHLLAERGVRPPERRTLLAPAASLLQETAFWQELGEGFAIYLGGEEPIMLRLPGNVSEAVVVGETFLLSPLVPFLQASIRYFVLAASQQKVQLFSITDDRVVPIPLRAQRDLRAAYGDEKQLASLQQHWSGPGSIVHGHGTWKEHMKKEIMEHFRMVDAEVSELLREEEDPLVFAGADPLYGIYRSLCSYPHLLPDHIEGNPERWTENEVRRRAEPIVRLHADAHMNAILSLYGDRAAGGKADDALEDILPAAFEGKVEALLLCAGARQPGIFNPRSRSVEVHDSRHLDDEDLLETAAAQTLLHDGHLYTLPPERMPTAAPLAAIFRY